MSCKYHFNWTTDTPCPYCRIDELEQALERIAEEGNNDVCIWDCSVYKIARKALGRG